MLALSIDWLRSKELNVGLNIKEWKKAIEIIIALFDVAVLAYASP
jgi:hypothetical protein